MVVFTLWMLSAMPLASYTNPCSVVTKVVSPVRCQMPRVSPNILLETVIEKVPPAWYVIKKRRPANASLPMQFQLPTMVAPSNKDELVLPATSDNNVLATGSEVVSEADTGAAAAQTNAVNAAVTPERCHVDTRLRIIISLMVVMRARV